MYDEGSGRVYLIDFELTHDRSLPAQVRQADDLRVVLQDMIALVDDRRWLPFALAFLRAYGNEEVLKTLRSQLVMPRGLARIWWSVRTNFGNPRLADSRLAALRDALAREYRSAPSRNFATA
jgi:hypothetical protein